MRAAPYLFDLDFDADGRPSALDEAERVDAARRDGEAQGYARGLAEGRASAEAAANRHMAEALDRVAAGAQALLARIDADCRRLESGAVETALAAAKKLAPALICREPVIEVAAMVARCLPHLEAAPHLVVRLRAEDASRVEPILQRLARDRGFAGRLVILGEPDIPAGDCRVEWADGGFVRDRAALEKRIDAAVAAYLAGGENRHEH